MQRYDHKYTHKYKSYLVSFYFVKSQVHAKVSHKYRHILAKSIYVHTGANNKLHEFQLTTHRYMQLSSTYTCQVKGTCNLQLYTCQVKVHLKKSTSQVQPGIYTKAKSKQKTRKNHTKNMLEKG